MHMNRNKIYGVILFGLMMWCLFIGDQNISEYEHLIWGAIFVRMNMLGTFKNDEV